MFYLWSAHSLRVGDLGEPEEGVKPVQHGLATRPPAHGRVDRVFLFHSQLPHASEAMNDGRAERFDLGGTLISAVDLAEELAENVLSPRCAVASHVVSKAMLTLGMAFFGTALPAAEVGGRLLFSTG